MRVIPVHAKKPAKLLLFFDMTKFFCTFCVKKCIFVLFFFPFCFVNSRHRRFIHSCPISAIGRFDPRVSLRSPARFGLNAGVTHAEYSGLFTCGAVSVLFISADTIRSDYSDIFHRKISISLRISKIICNFAAQNH